MTDKPFAGNEEADLSLATWMGISGAAISTGLGQNTSLGLSLLAGLSNLRLGVWWLPGKYRGKMRHLPKHWLPVQLYLFREFLGWFKGPQAIGKSRWQSANRLYLTDGGHFENTGVYELVRRRVPMIVACDNGADPDYQFEDVVNLTRKLRIDFDAALEFLPKDKLDVLLGAEGPSRAIFGEISELIAYSNDSRSQGPYAAIARIRKKAENGFPDYLATVILLKPRLSGLEMIDLLDYNRANQAFPQQPTGDQFFDEAQWESYFRLGKHIAGLVFSDQGLEPAPPWERWTPHLLEPVDPKYFSWFAEDWLPHKQPRGDSGEAKDCTPCSGAVAAAAVAAGSSPAGGLGFGQMLAAGVASLGALGATLGISQSLTTTAVSKLSTQSEASVNVTLDGDTRRILSEGIAVHLDPDVTMRLNAILAKLDVLIGSVTRIVGNINTSTTSDTNNSSIDLRPVVRQLQSIHDLLEKFTEGRDPAVLEKLLAEVKELRADGRVRGDDLKRQLADLNRDLSGAIRLIGPRPNSRSGL